MQFHALTKSEVTFSLYCEPEDDAPEDSFQFPEDAAFAREGLESGNEWAWCCVRVEAEWNGYKGTDYLGGCSYASRKDFMEPGGYYDDMKSEALADLNRTLADNWARLASRVA